MDSFTGNDSEWQPYSSPFKVTEEDKVVYARTKKDGKTLSSSLQITNVDAHLPTIESVELDGFKIKVKASDSKSGISSLKNKIEGTSKYLKGDKDWVDLTEQNGGNTYLNLDYTFGNNYCNDGSYTIYIRDAAGNIAQETRQFTSPPEYTGPATYTGGIKTTTTGIQQCPVCSKTSREIKYTIPASDEESGLKDYELNNWILETINSSSGQNTTAHTRFTSSPKFGELSGTYTKEFYIHDFKAGTPYTISILLENLFGFGYTASQEITINS